MMLDTQPHTRLETTHQGTQRQLRAVCAPCGSVTWHVCQTHPQAERWAAENLRRQGYAHYLPLIRVRRRDPVLRTLTRQVDVPLFANYLFVALGSRDPWTPVTNTRGVARLLMDQGRPATVATPIVEALQAGEDARRSIQQPGDAWQPGAPCKLASGAFDGHDAVVTKLLARGVRVAVLCFGAMQEITVPQHWIETR
jgi:transcriptional antiterminator RfaH